MLKNELSLGLTCPSTACEALDSWFGIFTAVKAFCSHMASEGARPGPHPCRHTRMLQLRGKSPPPLKGKGRATPLHRPPHPWLHPSCPPAAPERCTVLCTLVGACFTMKRSSCHTVCVLPVKDIDYPLVEANRVHHGLVPGVETFHKSR